MEADPTIRKLRTNRVIKTKNILKNTDPKIRDVKHDHISTLFVVDNTNIYLFIIG